MRRDDHLRGPADAPLLIVYADFTCPRCAVAHERISGLPLRVVFRHLALQAKHPRAVPLALAAEAFAAQDAFWPFHDAIYADQGHVDDPHLWDLARPSASTSSASTPTAAPTPPPSASGATPARR